MQEKKEDSRGVSPVVGILLLIGMVAIASLGLLAVGTDKIASTEQYAVNERTEQSFVELKQTMSTSTHRSDTTQKTDLDIGEGGAILREDTGSISIDYENLDGSLADPISFGTLEYQGDDGSTIAYEAGAVFRETGNETRIVSAPDLQYNDETNTLNFPVVEIAGEEELQSGNVRIDPQQPEAMSDVVENKTVTIKIESKYWRGWERYFISEVGERGVIAEPQDGSEKGNVTVNLGRIDHPTPFENAVHADEEIKSRGAATINGETEIDDSLESIDDEIAEKVTTAETEYEDLGELSGGTYDAGNYSADDVDLAEDLVFDLSDGDAVLVVDGDIDVDGGQFRVKNWGENDLKIYTTGDLTVERQMCLADHECEGSKSDRNGAKSGPTDLSPGQLQVYGTSDFKFSMVGNTYFEGVIYAPQDSDGDSRADITGNQYYDGSLVIGSADVGGNPTVSHHESLKWLDPDITGTANQPPELTYLNLEYHEVEVERK